MADLSALQNRITELELRFTHLQQYVDTLNEVILDQQRELQTWRAAFQRLESRMESLAEPEPPRDPLAERPPHY